MSVRYECRTSEQGRTLYKSDSIEDIRKKAYQYLNKSQRKELYIMVWRGKQPGDIYGIVAKKSDGIIFQNLEKRTVQYFKSNGTLYPYR